MNNTALRANEEVILNYQTILVNFTLSLFSPGLSIYPSPFLSHPLFVFVSSLLSFSCNPSLSITFFPSHPLCLCICLSPSFYNLFLSMYPHLSVSLFLSFYPTSLFLSPLWQHKPIRSRLFVQKHGPLQQLATFLASTLHLSITVAEHPFPQT